MNKTNRMLAAAFLALGLAGCAMEGLEDAAVAARQEGDAVRVSTTIARLDSRLAYEEGTGNTTFTAADKIRVQNTERTAKNVATYTYDGSSWSTTESLVWNGSATNRFEAWYPATADYTTFTIPTDQSGTTANNQITVADWMTASTGAIAKPADNTLTLAFKHLLTKVTVEVKTWNSEFPENNRKITNPEIYTKNEVVNVSYGTGAAGADVYTLWGFGSDITPLEGGTDANPTYTAIIAPARYDAFEEFMTFKIGEEDLTVHTKEGVLTDGLQPGYHYTFSLTVGKEKAEISSVTVTDWTPQTIDGGVAEATEQTTSAAGGE